MAIIFAFGEIRLISTVSFRLCGEHLLSLHDESRQRRAKEEKKTVRSGFLPFLWNLSHLSTDRDSPPSLKRRGLTDTLFQRGSRDLGDSTFTCLNCAGTDLTLSQT